MPAAPPAIRLVAAVGGCLPSFPLTLVDIVPDFSFLATYNIFFQEGARPRFACNASQCRVDGPRM